MEENENILDPLLLEGKEIMITILMIGDIAVVAEGILIHVHQTESGIIAIIVTTDITEIFLLMYIEDILVKLLIQEKDIIVTRGKEKEIVLLVRFKSFEGFIWTKRGSKRLKIVFSIKINFAIAINWKCGFYK